MIIIRKREAYVLSVMEALEGMFTSNSVYVAFSNNIAVVGCEFSFQSSLH